MHPLLFQIGFIKLHTYGLMIVIGFLIGISLIYNEAKRQGINPDRAIDISFYALAFGLLGGRIVYIFTRLDYFSDHPLEVFYFWEGGLVFYGGFIGGAVAFYFFSRKYQLPILKTMDLATPALAIAHFFGRLGCFSAGCCFGRPAPGVPWAVTFRDPLSLAPLNIPLHPTELYDALNALTIFTILMIVRRREKFVGQLLVLYMMLYSVGRSIVEIYRGDSIRGYVIDPYLSTSQFISIFVFATGAYLWMKWSKTKRIPQAA